MKSLLIAGDTLQFDTAVPDYLASAGWTLTYKLVPRTSGAVISFNASADGDDYTVDVSNTTTANWTAGEYSWAAYVTKGSERHTVDSGTCTIKPNPGVVTTLDSRSHARITLEAIEAVIQNRATMDQQEYSIHGRQLKRMPIADLMKFRTLYKSEVASEDAAERIRSGLSGGGNFQVRF